MKLTPLQIEFACALPIRFMLLKEIKRRIISDCSRVRWQELVNLGIADQDEGKSIRLRRGPRWQEFFDEHGYQDTANGCFQEEIIEQLPDFEMH